MSGSVLLVGATSGIGRALARRLAADGHDLILAGRREQELRRDARDLEIRSGIRASSLAFDARDWEAYDPFVAACTGGRAGELEGVVMCLGDMPEQADAEADPALARRAIDVNYASVVTLFERIAPGLQARGRGYLCAISSVAGDRGRPSNHIYGSTKAGLDAYLQGLRPRLAKSGVRVVTVKPGFVDTGLTFGRPGMFLVASPEEVAGDIVRAIERDRAVVYSPGFWRILLWIIRSIPDPIYKRLSL